MKRTVTALMAIMMLSVSILPVTAALGSSTIQYRFPVPADATGIPAGAVNIHEMSHSSVNILVSLNFIHQAALSSLISAQSTPGSQQYHKWLSPARFESLFSPPPSEVSAVTSYLEGFGMNVTHVSADRLLMDVTASAAELHSAFGTTLYSFTLDGQGYYSAKGAVVLPLNIAALISGVQGLQDYITASQPLLSTAGSPASSYTPPTGLNPVPPYNPATIHAAYNFTQAYKDGYSGTGTSVSIITSYAFDNATLQTFDSTFGIAPNRINVLQPTGSTTQLNLETTLDTEWLTATAPNSTINVIEGINPQLNTFTQLFSYAVNHNISSVITTSWGTPESQTPNSTMTQDNKIFKQAAAQGITIFAASGDFGAYDNTTSPTPDFPASSPYVSGVGGSWLNLTKTGNGGIAISSETGWNKSGGGMSAVFQKPSWQIGPGVPSGVGRYVPDVSLNAKPASGYFVYYNSSWLEAGGTSFGAPIWAGIMALENQLRAMNGESTMGLANPSFYRILNSSNYSTAFHDITQGYNGYYSAGPGYDMVTGVGTPSVYNLLLILAKQPTSPLRAIATGSPYWGDAPLYVSLYAEISGGLGPYNVSWALNGTTSGSFYAPFSYKLQDIAKLNNAGKYVIKLTVKDSVHEVSVSYFNVTVLSKSGNTLVASLLGSPTNGDANLTVKFSTSVSGGSITSVTGYFRYAFADSGYLTTSSSNVQHTYTSGGNYTALVTAYENGTTSGNYTAQSLFSVTVYPRLIANILSNRTGGSYPLHILFTAANFGGRSPFSYAWTYANQSGSFSSAGKHLYVNYSSVGNYTVTLSVTDFYNSHSIASENIRVYQPMTGSINVSPSSTGVAPYNATFVATVAGGAGGYSYSWNFGGGNTARSNPANFVFTGGGNFIVRLTVRDVAGDVLNITTHVSVQGLGLLQLFQNRTTLLIITVMIIIAAVVSYAIVRRK